MRSGFREVACLRGDRFLIADIPISMPVHAGRCRAEPFIDGGVPASLADTRELAQNGVPVGVPGLEPGSSRGF